MLYEEINPQKQEKYKSKKYCQTYHCCLRRSKIPHNAKAPITHAITPKKINIPISFYFLDTNKKANPINVKNKTINTPNE